MAGKWTELWDDERQKWVKVYLELPTPLTKGSATTASTAKPKTLYGPDERPLPPPERTPMGFRKPG
jgi:hypothetical protein